MDGHVLEPTASLVVILFARHIERRALVGVHADPALAERGRAGELHQEGGFPGGGFAGEDGDVARRDALVHQPAARLEREREVDERQRSLVAGRCRAFIIAGRRRHLAHAGPLFGTVHEAALRARSFTSPFRSGMKTRASRPAASQRP